MNSGSTNYPSRFYIAKPAAKLIGAIINNTQEVTMKKAVLFTLSLTLAACGGGGGSGGSTTDTNTPDITGPSGTISNTDGKLSIMGNGHTATVNSTTSAEISVTGNKNTVYIQTNTKHLDISGNENTVDISNGVNVGECTILGNKNKIVKSEGLKIECTAIGTDNTGFN